MLSGGNWRVAGIVKSETTQNVALLLRGIIEMCVFHIPSKLQQ